MSHTITKLRKMTTEELISEHDEVAKQTSVGLNYYLEELSRRDNEIQTKSMLSYTKSIFILTIVVTVATIINVVIAYYN